MYVQINDIDRNIYMISSVVLDDKKVIYKMINGVQLQEEFSSASEATAKYEEVISMSGGGGGTSDYEDLENKPSINGTTLEGDVSLEDIGIGSVFTIKGSVATPEDLPATGNSIGDVYYVESVMAGYVWIEDSGTERWEELGEPIDLSNYQEKLQFSNMPTASSSNEGLIVQYIGATTSSYTNGYFYQCVSDGEATPTYSWENIEVQASSSAGTPAYVITGNDADSIAALNTCCSLFSQGKPFNLFYLNVGDTFTNEHYLIPISIRKARTSTSYSFTGAVDFGRGNYFFQFTYIEVLPIGTWGSFSALSVNKRAVEAPRLYSSASGGALYTSNTTAFTPNVDSYNPATAKYAEKMVEAVATGYSTSSTYNVGDFVAYKGKLYKCTTAISVAESWNAAHWTETTAMAENSGGGGGSSTYTIYDFGGYTGYGDTYTSGPEFELGQAIYNDVLNNKFFGSKIDRYLSYDDSGYNVDFVTFRLSYYTTSASEIVLHYIWYSSAYGGNMLPGQYPSAKETTVVLNISNGSLDSVSIPYNDYDKLQFLSTTNSSEYTPVAGSYRPATAKYAESMLEAIAPAYDNTATYSVGDYVTRQGKLYVCSTAISQAEDWTSAHWTQTTVAGIIGNLNTVLASLTTPNNGGN